MVQSWWALSTELILKWIHSCRMWRWRWSKKIPSLWTSSPCVAAPSGTWSCPKPSNSMLYLLRSNPRPRKPKYLPKKEESQPKKKKDDYSRNYNCLISWIRACAFYKNAGNHFQIVTNPVCSKASLITLMDLLSIIPIMDPKWAFDIYTSFSRILIYKGPFNKILSSAVQLNKLALASRSNTFISTTFTESGLITISSTPFYSPIFFKAGLIFSKISKQTSTILSFIRTKCGK